MLCFLLVWYNVEKIIKLSEDKIFKFNFNY